MLKEAFSQMRKVFLPQILMRGQEYQQKGHVLNVRFSEGLVKARVKGNANQLYDVHINLKSWPSIPAHCSCPYATNCKHAAASFFALQAKEHEKTSMTTKENSLDLWLDALRQKEIKHTQDAKTHEVIYVIQPTVNNQEHRIMVNLALVKRLKRGGLGKKVIFDSITEGRKQYFTPEDEDIVATLLFKSNTNHYFDYLYTRNSELFEKILKTGRAYLANDTSFVDEKSEKLLTLDKELDAVLQWQLDSTGKQHLILESKSNGSPLRLFLLDKPWYVNQESTAYGPININLTTAELKIILNAPPIEIDDTEVLAKKIMKTMPSLPLPQRYEQREKKHIKPKPIISFDVNNELLLFEIDIQFEYNGIIVHANETNPSLFSSHENKLIEMPRDFDQEKEYKKELAELLSFREPTNREKLNSHYNLSNKHILTSYYPNDNLSKLYEDIIPKLRNRDWQVQLNSLFFKETIDAEDVDWYSDLDDQGNNFFSYQLGILIDNESVNIVPLVADWISKFDSIENYSDDEDIKLDLPNGKLLRLKLGRIKPLIRFLLQYGTRFIKDDKPLELTRYQLMLIEETENALEVISSRWRGEEQLRTQLQQLRKKTVLPEVSLPKHFLATLRDYQQQGINWLQFLRENQFSGILADDMGLGKTVQTLAHLQIEKEQGRLKKSSLIIAPTSLMGTWFEEAKRFTPQLKVLVFHGTERHSDDFDNYDLVVSTYGLIQRDKSRFIDYSFYYLILDEAQFIKNSQTKTTQIVQQIKATHRLCLSGTPLENHLGELWSLFHFLMPGLLGDAKQFRQFFRVPIEKHGDEEKRKILVGRIEPFLLRRTKNQVVQELPDKTEIIQTVELVGPQRDLYEAIRMSMEKKVREAIAKQGLNKSQIVLLDALLKLRQVCCDPRLVTLPEGSIVPQGSVKLDALMGLIENLVDEGRRVLVFSQFTSMLKLIEAELITRHYQYLKITGQTQNRQVVVNTFQEGKTPVFLISLKAGGTGLTLTQADTVIHYDPWWNPAAEDQASGRSHRIGQEKAVFVYKLIASGTVEEAILSMQEKKRQLFEGVLSQSINKKITLTEEDIEKFFMPLR